MEIFRDKRAKNTLKGIANDMQLEMNEFVSKQIAKATLTGKERMRLIGTGVRNYGFIDKAIDIARDNPEFVPPFLPVDAMLQEKEDFEEVRQLVFVLEEFLQAANSEVLVRGNKLFHDALRVYGSLQEMTKSCVPGAAPLFESLKSFFHKRRKQTDGKPTTKKLERDFHSLLRGTRDGEIVVKNESPHLEGGKRVVVDEVV
jgi:hypothetical protein